MFRLLSYDEALHTASEKIMINRSALVVRAKQPFFDWLSVLSDLDEDSVTLASMNEDPTVYLLPEFDVQSERDEILEEFFGHIFECELHAWWQDQMAWPVNRTISLFHEWFDAHWHTVIEDLNSGPIINDDDSFD